MITTICVYFFAYINFQKIQIERIGKISMQNDSLWEQEQELRRICMLMITHQCNLNCSYCYESYKSNLKMDFDTAINIIKRDAQKVKKSKKIQGLEIDLMGGEPMMNFPLIKELIEWAEKGNIEVPYIFAMTTNGTLFEDKEKEWFKKHKKSIICCCSYDGNIELQEINRGKNSKYIDIDFFVKTWPFQNLHMTVSKETLPNLSEGILFAQKKGYPVEVSLAEGINWSKEDSKIYKKELEKLAVFYLENSQYKPINLLMRYLDIVNPAKDRKVIKKFCGTGSFMTAYEPDGSAYGCHMFSPIVLGENAKQISDINFKCNSIANDEICTNCILKHYCPTCAGFNYRFRKDFGLRDKSKCTMHLQEAIISAKFQIKLIAQRKNKLTLEDAQHANQAIKTISIIENVKDTMHYPYSL